MCFSASASFAASALLFPTGFFALKKASNIDKRYLPIAGLPVVFGIQQAMEGGVWTGLGKADADMVHVYALGFMFFSHFFWLLWAPLSIWFLETHKRRKGVCAALTAVGFLYGAGMYFPVILYEDWLTVRLINNSISYDETRLIYDGFLSREQVRAIYAMIVLTALWISSNQHMRYFGVLIAASLVVARVFF